MSFSDDGSRRNPLTPAELDQNARTEEYTRISSVEIEASELPLYIRIGQRATYYALIDPRRDLTIDAQRSAQSKKALNQNLNALLIEPGSYDFPNSKGYKALRPDETVVLGRSHQHEAPRFRPLDQEASRSHVSITEAADGKSFTIKDLDSLNGTYISGQPAITLDAFESGDTQPTPVIKVERELSVEAYGATTAAEYRGGTNQDSFLVDHESQVYAVFDGVGGALNGQLASLTAKNFIYSSAAEINPSGITNEQRELIVREKLHEASERVMVSADGGSTTATLVSIHESEGLMYASVAHAGDSRAYLLREGSLRMLTLDHGPSPSIHPDQAEATAQQERLAELADEQHLRSTDLRAFRSRNVISSSLGPDSTKIDVESYIVMPGDRLLLTTDGIHDNLTTTEMAQILNDTTASRAANALINRSRNRAFEGHFRSKDDDMTAVVIAI